MGQGEKSGFWGMIKGMKSLCLHRKAQQQSHKFPLIAQDSGSKCWRGLEQLEPRLLLSSDPLSLAVTPLWGHDLSGSSVIQSPLDPVISDGPSLEIMEVANLSDRANIPSSQQATGEGWLLDLSALPDDPVIRGSGTESNSNGDLERNNDSSEEGGAAEVSSADATLSEQQGVGLVPVLDWQGEDKSDFGAARSDLSTQHLLTIVCFEKTGYGHESEANQSSQNMQETQVFSGEIIGEYQAIDYETGPPPPAEDTGFLVGDDVCEPQTLAGYDPSNLPSSTEELLDALHVPNPPPQDGSVLTVTASGMIDVWDFQPQRLAESGIRGLIIQGTDETDDTLVVDLSRGDLPIPVTFHGGAGGYDTLIITGMAAGTYTPGAGFRRRHDSGRHHLNFLHRP